jgi:uncharacterized phage-associated protein
MAKGFNSKKAAQVIAYLALKSPSHRLHVVKAVKLVYLADRMCLESYGFPIIDDDRVSMPHGPVNSTTYRYINGECESADWSSLLRDRSNHEVSLKSHAHVDDWDELSDAEIDILDTVWDRFGGMNQWQLRDWTHEKKNVPEWEDPNGSSMPIPMSRILRMLRVDAAEDQASLIEDHRNIDILFNSIRR